MNRALSLIAVIFFAAASALPAQAEDKHHQHHDHMKKAAEQKKGDMKTKQKGHGSHGGHKSHTGQGHHGGHKQMNAAKLDLATEKMSAGGHFKVAISSQAIPVKINHMHAWVLDIKSHGGNPVSGAKIQIDGGMPAHGHGLPTAPRVTKELGDGKYLVEGVRFNMGGHWELKFDIKSAQMSDKVIFNLMLN